MIVRRSFPAVWLAAMCCVGWVFADGKPPVDAPIDALGDEPMVIELASRGLDDLLDRYVKTHPQAVGQVGVRAAVAMRDLQSRGDRLTASQRQQCVRQILAGADRIVPAIKDPRQLMRLAGVLIDFGVGPAANAIEYWGQNARRQAELRPVADLVAQVLDRCATLAREQADASAVAMGNSPTPLQLKQYNALDSLATTARYTRLMCDYYRALSMDPADAQRAKVAQTAITALAEFDAPDLQVQPAVRLRLGKLLLAKGDYPAAARVLQTLTTDASIHPAPSSVQQFEARYSEVVCELLGQNVDQASTRLAGLKEWAAASLAQDKAVRDGVAASLAIMRYRIEVVRGDLETNPAAKKAARAKANSMLEQLAKDRADLRGAIFEQLVKSLPDNLAMGALDTLLLKALYQQALAEQGKPESQPFDRPAVERGTDACREILKRTGQPAVDEVVVDDAGIVLPQLLEKLGRDGEAAEAYLRYCQLSVNPDNGQAAMQNLLLAIARIKAADANSRDADRLLDAALPIAVGRCGRKDLAFDLARRLEKQGKLTDAVAMYAQVPADDKRRLAARLFQMQAMKQLANTAGAPADTKTLADFAAELDKDAGAWAATAVDPSDRDRGRLIQVRARLMSATLMQREKPALALRTLVDFQNLIAGLPAEDELQAESLFLQVRSLMSLGQNDQAAWPLRRLLTTKSADQGAAIVLALLNRLDADLDAARKAGDAVKANSLLDVRASLSGPLVQWAAGNRDERIRKFTYQYQVFDAATQQQAAMAQTDPRKRADGLRRALQLYSKLLDGENLARWRQTVDPEKVDVAYGDVAVLFAKAQVLYELGDYAEGQQRFGRLLADRKLGNARSIVQKDSEPAIQDNPQYWEAMYKLYQSNVMLADNPATPDAPRLMEETRNGLKRLYIREGKDVGGERWRDAFEKLKAQIIPGFGE